MLLLQGMIQFNVLEGGINFGADFHSRRHDCSAAAREVYDAGEAQRSSFIP